MARIENLSSGFSFFKSTKKKKKDEIAKGSKIKFSRTVEKLLGSGGDLSVAPGLSQTDNLEEALDEVFQLGEQLKELPTFENIKEYKKSIQRFFQFIVENAVALDEKVSGVNILKRKRFTLIKIIDQKLENLVTGMLSNQVKQIDILSKVDEINGLLIDLTR